MAVKVYQAQKSLQLFDILRGGGQELIAAVVLSQPTRHWNHVPENFQSLSGKNSFFEIDRKAIAARVDKNASKWMKYVYLSREPTQELSS